MQADMDEEIVHLKLDGKMAELLVQPAPSLYRKIVQIVRGNLSSMCSYTRHSMYSKSSISVLEEAL